MVSSYVIVTVTALLSISVIAPTISISAALALDSDRDRDPTLPHGINLQHINFQAEPTVPPAPINFTVDFILNQGYPVEVHEVTTADGYVLTLHRIPGSPYATQNGDDSHHFARPPVLMHHGLSGCAADYVVLGPQRALGFVVADVGYDVWLANARGTTNSKKHATMNTTDRDFWAFSWHEIGSRDLPAEIDYILNVTGTESLTYVGYSMGTTAFWVMGATMPHYIGKVNQMIALAPVAFFEHVEGMVFKTFAYLASNADWVVSTLGPGEFLPTNKFITWAARTFCKDDAWTQRLCKNVMFLLCGFDSTNITESTIATIFEYNPAGSSTKEFLHYAQLVRGAPAFTPYNYGWIKNLMMYGRLTPPPYRLAGVACPVHIFAGENDWVGNKEDVNTLMGLLPDVQSYHVVNRSTFNHLDFLYANDAYELVYQDVLEIMTKNRIIASGGDKDISTEKGRYANL